MRVGRYPTGHEPFMQKKENTVYYLIGDVYDEETNLGAAPGA
jgi:hypothetical protein